ncbi:MAG: amino acid ABC transporter substrate-binding protein [Chloroflexi bacterium]|nr:amino acid ABC transporter substrate-binding protein [Chloroflexota bacterium]
MGVNRPYTGWKMLLSAIAAAGLLAAAMAGGSRAALSEAGKPIKIGISVSLTGDFSGDGKSIQQGYNLWAADVNRSGGLLGRRVTLDYVDDASSTTQIMTNIQKLINADHVDLLFGPFSSLLTIPAARVANRFGYAFPEPAGGGPAVFQARLPNLVFVQPAPVVDNLVSFTRWLAALPPGQRPTTAAYATEDDPFAKPQVSTARALLEKAGVRTVYNTVFPGETPDFGPVALRIIHSRAQAVLIGTTGLPEATTFIKTFIQQHYNPRALTETSGPDQGAQFAKAVGARNTEGIIVPGAWWPGARTFYNRTFVSEFLKRYGGTAGDISADAAEAYSVGQVVAQAVARIHSIDNGRLIKALHTGTFQTIQGPIRFDAIGEPQGQMFLVQWQHGVAIPVYPASVATARPEYPKPSWH